MPFLVLAEERHFTRTAERLHVAQPALSQQISRLETQLGGRLFDRSPQDVTLTPLGAAFLEEVRPAMAGVDAAITRAREVAGGRAGLLRVLYLSSLATPVVPLIAAALRAQAPAVELQLSEQSVLEQLEALRAGRADVGMYSRFEGLEAEEADLRVELLVRGPRYVALPVGHRLAGAARLARSDLAGEPIVLPSGGDDHGYRGAVLAALRRDGVDPVPGPQADTIGTILGLVAQGFGVATVAWPNVLVPRPDVVYVRLDGEAVDLVAATADRPPGAAAAFVEAAREVLQDLVPRA